MGCFLGCFGDAKDRKNRKQRTRRAVPRVQRSKDQNDGQQSISFAYQSIPETLSTDLVSQLLNKPEEEEKFSPSPKKRVTFNSNITTYEHVSVFESTDSLLDYNVNNQREKEEDPKRSKQAHSESEDENSVTPNFRSYPSNHRYHNARDSDDEEEYGDSDLDNLDDLEDEDEDDCDDDDEDDNIDSAMTGKEVWSESILIASTESRTENHSAGLINVEVESPMMKTRLHNEEVKEFGSKTHARDRSDYVNSVLNPVENITQWKAAKSKGMHSLKKHKENLTCNDAPHIPYSSEPMYKQSSFSLQTKSDQLKKSNQEIAVDASLSNWLVSPPSKKTSSCGLESIASGKTESKGSNSVRSFDDRPILGALTVDELKQLSVSSSPKKSSPSRSPDEMPIIGSVGTYWNHSNNSTKNFYSTSLYQGIPNTANKYREDNRVNWQSTPFETRLEKALNQGSAEA